MMTLIKFDRKVAILLSLSLFLYIAAVFFKLHGSAVAIWDTYLSSPSQQCLLFGKPKDIRRDEWGVVTPAIISQANQVNAFSVYNESLGSDKTPLLINVPVRHFSIIFRPQYWGFFLFDLERGFSFYWNFKVFGLFISFFLLLMLFTKNDFWLSVTGSLWMYFSAFTQWWFSTPAMMPEMITSFSMIIVSMAYLALSNNQNVIFLSSLCFSAFFINFVLCSYPPFQIPLLYLLFTITLCFYINYLKFKELYSFSKFKIICCSCSVLVLTSALYFIYKDTKSALDIIGNTFYPGSRYALGGDFGVMRIFSGLYSIFMTEKNFPEPWINICEASSFIFLSPVVFLVLFRDLKKWIKQEPLILGLFIYEGFLFIWLAWGFPRFLAFGTLLSFVPSRRALIGLGISDIIITMLFLSKMMKTKDFSYIKDFFLLSIFFIFSVLNGFFLNKSLNYFTSLQIFIVSALFACLAFAVIKRKKNLFSMLICLIVVFPSFMINPVSKGLAPVLKNKMTILASQIKFKDPKSKWVVFGDPTVANFLKSAGVSVVNGTQFVPHLDWLKTLSSSRRDYFVYNRYAIISLIPLEGLETIEFNSDSHHSYTLKIHPCNDKLMKVGVNYFIFTDGFNDIEHAYGCLEPLCKEPIEGRYFYKRKF